MPDFDTRKPQEQNAPNEPRTGLVVNKLRTTLLASRLRTLLIGGGIRLFVVAVPVGLLIYSLSNHSDPRFDSLSNHADPWSACAADRGSQQPFVLSYAADIWTMDIDGSNRQQLTATGEVNGSTVVEAQPAWSPNHKWIAFYRSHYVTTSGSAEPEGQSGIYVMNADGSCQTKLVGGDASDPTWSPDGTKIAFSKPRPGYLSSIYVMNADGSGDPKRATTKYLARDANPAWSPDGKKIAFERTNHIYVTRACCELGPTQQLTSGHGKDSYPSWSPDGTDLAFTHSDLDVDGLTVLNTDIYKIDADGSGETRLTHTNSSKHPEYAPVWSPSGDRLAFIEGDDSNTDSEYSSYIYLMESDGSQPTVVARAPEIAYRIVLDWGYWQPLTPKSRSVTVHPPHTGGSSLILVASGLLLCGGVLLYAMVKPRM